MTGHDPRRVSPFGHPRIKAYSAAPRGLSQPATSFLAYWRQGIHRVPFLAWQLKMPTLAMWLSKIPENKNRTAGSLRTARAGAPKDKPCESLTVISVPSSVTSEMLDRVEKEAALRFAP